MNLPNTYTDKNETGCCPVPNIKAWDKQEVQFDNRHFIRMYTRSFFYMPINMSSVMTRLSDVVRHSEMSLSPEQTMRLSRDLSPWKAEQLYSVAGPVEGADNVTINGTFLTMVFEGPYKDVPKWHQTLLNFAKEKDRSVINTYFFYTTCPKCAKHYGKNYTIGLVEVA